MVVYVFGWRTNMKEYIVSACFGGILSEQKTFKNHIKAIEYVKTNHSENIFYTIDTLNMNGRVHRVTVSEVFYGKRRVASYKRKATIDDIKHLDATLPRVYYCNGAYSLLPSRALTTTECLYLIGDWFHIKVLNDEGPRMALVYMDVDRKDKKPPLNEYIFRTFGEKMYGRVIYINECYL